MLPHRAPATTDVLVAGAGPTGLTTALLLARAGHHVTLLDRDAAAPPDAASCDPARWSRPGVAQFTQPHYLLPRWTTEMRGELPDLLDRLVAAGATRVNQLHLQPESATCGWHPGDERFDTVATRRALLEAVLTDGADHEPGVVLRRGVRATGLLHATEADGAIRVTGLRTTAGAMVAGLVVDAMGRRTPLPGWVGDLDPTVPRVTRQQAGFVYCSRQFRARADRPPRGAGPVLVHHPSLSVLTIPQDRGTYAIALVRASGDRGLRGLREVDAWSSVARTCPTSAAWVAEGTPTTAVTAYATRDDRRLGWVGADGPRLTGVVAVGDAWATTSPMLGRGATLGLLHAQALRDVLDGWPDGSPTLAVRAEDEADRRIAPWVEASWSFTRHRAAQMAAEATDTAYETEDPAWVATTALLAGAWQDPVLARCASAVGGLLEAPATVLSRPDVAARLRSHVGRPIDGAGEPTRRDLLHALGTTPAAVPGP